MQSLEAAGSGGGLLEPVDEKTTRDKPGEARLSWCNGFGPPIWLGLIKSQLSIHAWMEMPPRKAVCHLCAIYVQKVPNPQTQI